MGVYQFNVDDQSDASWTLLGSAIKAAQNLGLSRLGPENEARKEVWPEAWKSFRRRELGRRVWWNLVSRRVQLPPKLFADFGTLRRSCWIGEFACAYQSSSRADSLSIGLTQRLMALHVRRVALPLAQCETLTILDRRCRPPVAKPHLASFKRQ